MFSRISRLPLRRCLHTGASAPNSSSSLGRTAKVIVGVSIFSTAYLAWRLRESRHIALDSTNSSPSSASEPSLIHSDSPSGLTFSSNSPQNDEVLPSSTDLDTDTISEDTQKGDKLDEEGSSGSPASGGAFNPETGEINWDCPCLGGMAHGPCGPEFREAFSCFVFSEAEPKGINCVEKFQNMQNCFRTHPEIYADEIMNDDDNEQPPHPESSDTDKVDDATPELNTPSKPPIEGEVSS